MRKYRASVLLAWIFCAFVIAASIYELLHQLSRNWSMVPPSLLISDAIWNLIPILFAVPAALIISHQPRNGIGWLLMALPLAAISITPIERYLASFQAAPPPVTLPILLMFLISEMSWLAVIFPILLIPLYFPTGRLLTPRWRGVVYLAVGMILFLFIWGAFSKTIQPEYAHWTLTNPLGVIPNEANRYIEPAWTVMLAILAIASLASIVIRYRRAEAVEREQMKWLLYACSMFGLIYIPSLFFHEETATGLFMDLFNVSFVFVIGAIPVAITIAVLRYHLFDISVIIRLTLVYAIVTGLLGLVYVGGVILLQGIFQRITGEGSTLALVITTLAIAALFNPLRQRVQAVINRRFYREKYDADQALAEFSNAARGGSDLDDLSGMLLDLTMKTLQPTQVGLMIKTRIVDEGK